MFVRVTRTAVVPVWLAVFGLAALVWSPMSALIGALLLVAAIAGPVALLIWRAR